MTNSPAATTARSWQRAGEAHDADSAVSCLASDIEIISPLTAQFKFRGHDQAREMLLAAFEVIDVIKYHTEVGDDSARALFYAGRCGRQEFEEAQLLRFDEAGLIREITFFGRPLPGITAVMAGIGPALLRRQGRPGMARFIGLATAPLALLTRTGESRLVPLADPNRAHSGRR